MYEINDRIKELRKVLNLSQTEFGERLHVSRGVINNIDHNIVEPKSLFLNNVAATFNVNRDWLETGEGDMFVEKTREEEIAEWAASLNDSGNDFKRRFIFALSRLDEAGWLTIEHFAQMLYEEQLAEEEQAKQKDGGN
jgi:transcriptional regulator with XRE-family HTH domain